MAPATVSGGVVAYEDLFEVIDRDADGKKFDKVSRFRCRSQFEAELQIDINVDIYNLEVSERQSERARARAEDRFLGDRDETVDPRPSSPSLNVEEKTILSRFLVFFCAFTI